MKNLNELAHIFTGHTVREKLDAEFVGDCSLIQGKDIDIATGKLTDSLQKISSFTLPPIQILQPNDILLLSKGASNKAILYEGQFEKAAAVSAFIVIRLTTTHVIPEFLVWYLNSQIADEHFNFYRLRGSTTFNLPKTGVDTLNVPLLPMEKQKQMLNLISSQDRYNKLMADILRNTNLLTNQTLKKNLKND